MQDIKHTIAVLEGLVKGIQPQNGEVFQSNSSYLNAEVSQALVDAIVRLKLIADKGKQGEAWSVQEDELLKQHFLMGLKTIEMAHLHQRSKGAIRARLKKLELIN